MANFLLIFINTIPLHRHKTTVLHVPSKMQVKLTGQIMTHYKLLIYVYIDVIKSSFLTIQVFNRKPRINHNKFTLLVTNISFLVIVDSTISCLSAWPTARSFLQIAAQSRCRQPALTAILTAFNTSSSTCIINIYTNKTIEKLLPLS